MKTVAYEGQKDSVDKGVQPDGRRLFIFSQSKLKQVDTCPERGRAVLLGEMPDHATDSTALGHAVHEVIELCLADIIEGQGAWRLADMIEVAESTFNDEMDDPEARWVKVKTPATIHAQLARCLTTWYELVLPTLDPMAVEVNFGPLTIHEDEQRVIQVRGQIDYIDRIAGLADWKTAGRKWDAWEHQRWDVQPTMYTWAKAQAQFDFIGPDVIAPWTWHVLNVDGSYQKIETTRGPNDWAWLKDRCVVIAKQLEANLESWPLNDASALCSPKWCGLWSSCKGKHMGDNWP